MAVGVGAEVEAVEGEEEEGKWEGAEEVGRAAGAGEGPALGGTRGGPGLKVRCGRSVSPVREADGREREGGATERSGEAARDS